MTNIEELNLNDSILMGIEIQQGQVELKINYIDDYDTQESSIKTLVFVDCSKFDFEMHYCYDSFGAIYCGTQKDLGDYIEYRIETITTASVMIIHAKELKLAPMTKDCSREEV